MMQYMPSAAEIEKAYQRKLRNNRDWKRRQSPEKRRALRNGKSCPMKFAIPWSHNNDETREN
jgi:hypothetical protein